MQAFNSFVFDTPLTLVALTIGLFLFACARLGLALGRVRRRGRDGEDEKSVDVLLGTLLALLGLLIAFTYSFALDRHGTRKAAILLEANALGTAFLRADLLEEPARARLRTALERYARTRFYHPEEATFTTENTEKAIAASEEAQSAVWPATVEGAATLAPPLAALLISAVNDVLDAHVIRAAALRDRVPGSVVLLAIGVAGGALFTTTQAAGYRGDTRVWRALVYAATVTLVITMILDFDRPRRGLILVDVQPLISAWEGMAADLEDR